MAKKINNKSVNVISSETFKEAILDFNKRLTAIINEKKTPFVFISSFNKILFNIDENYYTSVGLYELGLPELFIKVPNEHVKRVLGGICNLIEDLIRDSIILETNEIKRIGFLIELENRLKFHIDTIFESVKLKELDLETFYTAEGFEIKQYIDYHNLSDIDILGIFELSLDL